ncbi:MAG: HAD family hydrolase [Methanomicrobiales archaeon]|nr:HAD family hydrolase [Methanomicrobiales archaeon]
MATAVVFDSAGTLLHTFRMAKNVLNGELLDEVETTMLTFEDPDRVLCVLHGHSWDFIKTDPDRLLSEYLRTMKIGFGISCTRKVIEKDTIRQILEDDQNAKILDIQECMRVIWNKIKSEEIVALNNGIIVHTGLRMIEFTVTAGGTPFPGAKETISALHQKGIFAYIASGDRETKLERMADYLGIPRNRVFGVATPTVKEQIVRDLKGQYDLVIMVGDSINDLRAMRASDIAILSDQQSSDKPAELVRAAGYRIRDLREVLDIIHSAIENI